MVLDPSDMIVDAGTFPRNDWTNTEYGLKMKDKLPGNMPISKGQGFVIRVFVDADHAGDSITRRSRTAFIIYLNCVPVYWLSKKQVIVETSLFESEFIAMKQ